LIAVLYAEAIYSTADINIEELLSNWDDIVACFAKLIKIHNYPDHKGVLAHDK
jgi:hypothetical protein